MSQNVPEIVHCIQVCSLFFETVESDLDLLANSNLKKIRKIMIFLNGVSRSDCNHQTVRNFPSALHVRMVADGWYATFPNITFAAALSNADKSSRDTLTVDKI